MQWPLIAGHSEGVARPPLVGTDEVLMRPTPQISMTESNMLLKSIQTLVPEFPKLEMGEPSTRAHRLKQWIISITQAVSPAGLHVTDWWTWVYTNAEAWHRVFTQTPLADRERVIPLESVPTHLNQVEA